MPRFKRLLPKCAKGKGTSQKSADTQICIFAKVAPPPRNAEIDPFICSACETLKNHSFCKKLLQC